MTAMYWTQAEIQELLEITLNYKEEKCRQDIDWRSHPSTYEDIWRAFVQVYPAKQAERGESAFQHDVETITKAKVIFKLKDMHRRFNKAWHSDGPIFYARFWDICDKIWGERALLQDDDGGDENLLEDEDSRDLSSIWDSDCSFWSSTESEEEEDLESPSPPCKRKILHDNYFNQEYKEKSMRIHQELIEGMRRYQSAVMESMRLLEELFKPFPHPEEQQWALSSSNICTNFHLDQPGSPPELKASFKDQPQTELDLT